MKKNLFIFAALGAIALTACKKEGLEETSVSNVCVPVSIEVAAPGQCSKIALDPETYAQTWKVGDEIMFHSYVKTGSDGATHTSENVLSATGSGASAVFYGEASVDENILGKYSDSYNYLISPASSWTKVSTNNQYLKVPVTQSGKLDDFGKYSISYSRSFKLIKNGDNFSYPAVNEMLNLCPAIRFNIAEGLDVKKIVIKGYTDGVETLLAAERSSTQNDAIQIKIGSSVLYGTKSTVKTLTIDRTPGNDNLSQKEEISGDVFAVLAPNFPQTSDGTSFPGRQWEGLEGVNSYKIYDNPNNLDYHRPYNTCDILEFTFYNSNGATYTFSAPLKDKLYSGKIKNLGSITKDIFITDGGLSIDAETGNLVCLNSDENVKVYVSYEMADSDTDPNVPSNPVIDDANLFPEGGIAIGGSGSLTNMKIKLLPVKNGKQGMVKNAYVRKFSPVNKSYNMTLEPGQSGMLGFMNITNISETVYVKFGYSSDGKIYTYNHYTDSSLQTRAGNGRYTSGTFASKYPGASCSFFVCQNNKNRQLYFEYIEGETVIKADGYYKQSEANSKWYTDAKFQTTTIVGNGTVSIGFYTDSTPLKGFAWLEQGFQSF